MAFGDNNIAASDWNCDNCMDFYPAFTTAGVSWDIFIYKYYI